MRPVAALLSAGARLHLQHGPIDLILGTDGVGRARQVAFDAATARFQTVLEELVEDLPALRRPVGSQALSGEIACQMQAAVRPYLPDFVTPMAAVAGAVADAVLQAMCNAAELQRAYVNNGGDIAIHLSPGAAFTTAMAEADGADLGRIRIKHGQGIGGLATSGRLGRSLSRGIADSVTVLAASAAQADAAATMISNAVDLPGHAAVQRSPANTRDPDSDLGDREVVTGCGYLSETDCAKALANGADYANHLVQTGLIQSAALFLRGACSTVGASSFTPQRSLIDA